MAVSNVPSEPWLKSRVPLSAIVWVVSRFVEEPCSVAPLSMMKVLVRAPVTTSAPAAASVEPNEEVPLRVRVPAPSWTSLPEPESVPS